MPLRFGNFQLDEKRFELRRDGVLVDVQPRVLETILFLVKHRNRLVTKEELLAGPWSGMTVSDAALSQAIRQARSALGDDPQAHKFIETVRGRGYRFRGDVSKTAAASDSAPPSVRLRPFYGRQWETKRLQLAAADARSGHGNVVLIHGPAGAGKTRLAQWFAAHQREAGSEVCWGGCREGQSAPPFWPWPEVLHRYTETRSPAIIEPLARDVEQDLVAVAPELREALGTAATSTPDESPERAQSVLDAITTFLRRAAERAPLTLVLEDLHLADDAALQLLEVIARSIADTELIILGTFRRTEGTSRPVLRAVCEGSLPYLQGLALDGLSLGDVRNWLSAASPLPLPDSVVDALHFSTEGLPLFVESVVEDFPTWNSATAAEFGTRGRVNEILRRRLRRLDDATIDLLRTAAVCGEEFPVALLGKVTEKPPSALLPHLDQAERQGVLKPASEGSLRFAHALHQELLYRDLPPAERRQQHATFAKAFAEQLSREPDVIVQAAHHYLEAIPQADPKEAVRYAQQAAEWARARHSYARAAEYYQRALEVLDMGAAAPRLHAELLLALAHTQFVAGAVDNTTETLERAFELTKSYGYYDLYGRAILIWFQLRRDAAAVDPLFHARIAEALENVREKGVVFAQLQVARAMAAMFTSTFGERVSWIQEALSLTRHGTDPRSRLDVVRGALRCYTSFTDGTTELELADEMLRLAIQLRASESEIEARPWRAQAVLEFGRGAEFTHDVTACMQQSSVVRSPQATWVSGVLHACHLFMSGSLDESERVVRETGNIGQALMGIGGYVNMLTQLFPIALEYDTEKAQDILSEVIEGSERVLAVAPTFEALVALLARARMHCGQYDAAKEYLAKLTSPRYVPLDRLDRNFLPAMACIADLACSLHDATAAEVVSHLIAPYQGKHAVACTGGVYMGPASYWLGRLSSTRGLMADAQGQLEIALSESTSAGSVIYHAWSQYHLAHALPANQTLRSHSLLEGARDTARRYSLGRLTEFLASPGNGDC